MAKVGRGHRWTCNKRRRRLVPCQSAKETCFSAARVEARTHRFLLDLHRQISPILAWAEESVVLQPGIGKFARSQRRRVESRDGVMKRAPFRQSVPTHFIMSRVDIWD